MFLPLIVYKAGMIYSSEATTITAVYIKLCCCLPCFRRRFYSSLWSVSFSFFLKFTSSCVVVQILFLHTLRSCACILQTFSRLQSVKSLSTKSFHCILWPPTERLPWDGTHAKSFLGRRHSSTLGLSKPPHCLSSQEDKPFQV